VFEQFLFYLFAKCDSDEHVLQYGCCYCTIYTWLVTAVCLYIETLHSRVLEKCFWGPGIVKEFFVTKEVGTLSATAKPTNQQKMNKQINRQMYNKHTGILAAAKLSKHKVIDYEVNLSIELVGGHVPLLLLVLLLLLPVVLANVCSSCAVVVAVSLADLVGLLVVVLVVGNNVLIAVDFVVVLAVVVASALVGVVVAAIAVVVGGELVVLVAAAVVVVGTAVVVVSVVVVVGVVVVAVVRLVNAVVG